VAGVVNGSYVPHGLAMTPTTIELTPTAKRVIMRTFINCAHFQIRL